MLSKKLCVWRQVKWFALQDEMISSFFQPILYQFFFLHFCFWETGYLTLQSGQTAVLVKQNGNYWDPNAIAETFGDFMNKEASVETVRE